MRILDLFCGAGGAAMGIHEALPDAEIIGIDIKPQAHYPFKFVQGDAMHYLDGALRGFDFIWASPPCQAYTLMRHMGKRAGENTPDLIDPVREQLLKQDVPWVIENVI